MNQRQSLDANCLFCRIIRKEIPSEVVFESEQVLAFKDIHPQAPLHILLISKRHIVNISYVTQDQTEVITSLFLSANHIADQFKITASGFRLVVNCNQDGGQTVDHLHVHLLGGRPMTWPPG